MADAAGVETELEEGFEPELDELPEDLGDAPEEDPGSDQLDDLMLLADEDGGEFPESDEIESPEDVTGEPSEDSNELQGLSSGAQKRFQSLSNRAKEAEDRAMQLEEQSRQAQLLAQQQAEQYQAYAQQLQAQMAQQQQAYQQQMYQLQQQWQQQQTEKQLEQMTPEERFRHQIVQAQQEATQKAIQEQLSPLQQQLQQIEHQRQAALQNVQKQRRMQQWEGEAAQISKQLLDGFDDESLSTLDADTQELAFAFAAGYKSPNILGIQDKISRYLDGYYNARLQRDIRAKKSLRDQNKAAPKVAARTGQGQKAGTYAQKPDKRTLDYHGMTALDWRAAGSPALPPPPNDFIG